MGYLWKWKCPICGKQGRLNRHRFKAKRTGKVHIMRIHNKKDEPLMLKFKSDDNSE